SAAQHVGIGSLRYRDVRDGGGAAHLASHEPVGVAIDGTRVDYCYASPTVAALQRGTSPRPCCRRLCDHVERHEGVAEFDPPQHHDDEQRDHEPPLHKGLPEL